MSKNPMASLVAIFLLFAAVIRLWFFFRLHPFESYIYSDMDYFYSVARNLREVVPDPYGFQKPMGFSILISWALRAGAHWKTIIKIAQFLFSMGSIVLMWRTALLISSEKIALLLLAFLSFDFASISLGGFLMAEACFGFFISLLFYLLVKYEWPWKTWEAVIIAVAFFVSFQVKGNHVLFPVLVVLYSVKHFFSGSRQDLKPAAIFSGVIFAGLLLHGTLSYVHERKFRLTSEGGATNFVEAFCDQKKVMDKNGAGWISSLHNQLGENQALVVDAPFYEPGPFYAAGLRCIREHPQNLLKAARYIYYLFLGNELWPTDEGKFRFLERWHEIFFGFLLWPGLVMGTFVICRKPLNRYKVAYLLPLSVVVGTWLLKSELRFRIPFDGIFFLISLLGWDWFTRNLSKSAEKKFFPVSLTMASLLGVLTLVGLALA